MLPTSNAYAEAITGNTRHMLIKATLDLISPDLAFEGADGSAQDIYGDLDQLYDKNNELTRMASLEHNRWTLDGTVRVDADSPEVACETAALFDPDDATGDLYCSVDISGVSALQVSGVYFPTHAADGVPEDFTVEFYMGASLIHTETVTGNKESFVEVSGFTALTPTAVMVHVTKWSLPDRRMRVAEIIPGTIEYLTDGDFAEFSLQQQGNPSSVLLPYGSCSFTLDNSDRRFDPRNKNGLFLSIEDRIGFEVALGVDLGAEVEWQPCGVFYLHSGGWKTSTYEMTIQWDLIDIVGLLCDRLYIPPDVLPSTLDGWVASVVGQLGANFTNKYTIADGYGTTAMSVNAAAVENQTCGQVIQWLCLATGLWARADAATGNLLLEPMSNSNAGEATLDNLTRYPIMYSNDDLAFVEINQYNSGATYVVKSYRVPGNTSASANTLLVADPFIQSQAQVETAVQMVLSCYGGNRIEITGRGDPANEIGDVMKIQLSDELASSARLTSQSLSFSDGVMRDCTSELLQADGIELWTDRAVFIDSGEWVCPDDVTSIQLILIGKGEDGTKGTDGTMTHNGVHGDNGNGGRVWFGTITVTPGATYVITIGDESEFGAYSSANGERVAFTDIKSGKVYARRGVQKPKKGSGDGGAGGMFGWKGYKYRMQVAGQWSDPDSDTYWATVPPTKGKPGAKGATGSVIIYYEEELTTE